MFKTCSSTPQREQKDYCMAPVSSSRALVESLFSSPLNRSWIETEMRIGSAISPLPDLPLWILDKKLFTDNNSGSLSLLVNRYVYKRSTSWPSVRTSYGGRRLGDVASLPEINPTLWPHASCKLCTLKNHIHGFFLLPRYMEELLLICMFSLALTWICYLVTCFKLVSIKGRYVYVTYC